MLALGLNDCSVKIWDFDNNTTFKTLIGSTNLIKSLCVSSDGKYLAGGSIDGTIKIWDFEVFQELITLESDKTAIINVCFSPDNRYLASIYFNNIIEIWDVIDNFNCIIKIDNKYNCINSICFLHGIADTKVIYGCGDNTIGMFSITKSKWFNFGNNFKKLPCLVGHTRDVLSVCVSPDNKYLASGSCDKTIKIWNTDTFKELFTLVGHTNWVIYVCFSPDGKYLASGSDHGIIKIWDTKVFQELYMINTDNLISLCFSFDSMYFSPDSKYLASKFDNKSIKIWDSTNNFQIVKSFTSDSSILSLCFCPYEEQYEYTLK